MDNISKESRSKLMARVRSKNTRLEAKLIAILRDAGLKNFRCYERSLPGTPDIVFRTRKVAVFLDSCFWHGCAKHLRRPVSNSAYWVSKIDSNVKRDRRQRAAIRNLGWKPIRVWEHELKEPPKIVKKICRALAQSGKLDSHP